MSYEWKNGAWLAAVVGTALLLAAGGIASADTEGALSPGTVSTGGFVLTGVESTPWVNPENADASEDARATASLGPNVSSVSLNATNFAFNIPTDATIDGIEVFVEGLELGGESDEPAFIGKPIKGGVLAAGSQQSTIQLQGEDVVYTLGGATDLWGDIWTPADINATSFGYALVAIDGPSFEGGGLYEVDHISITIHFTPAATMPASDARGWALMGLVLALTGAIVVWKKMSKQH